MSYPELIIELTPSSSSLYYFHISLDKVNWLSVVFIIKTKDVFSKFKIMLCYPCDFESKSTSVLQAYMHNLHGHLLFLLRTEWCRKLDWLLLRSLPVFKSLWFYVHHFCGILSLVCVTGKVLFCNYKFMHFFVLISVGRK